MLASIIRNVLAPELLKVPPECGVVTITEVDVSQDYSMATVYVTSFSNNKLLLEYLNENKSLLQHTVVKNVARRRIPAIRFRIDERIERGNTIDELLKKG